MGDFVDKVYAVFEKVEAQLDLKLTRRGYIISKQIISENDFGSRFTEWRNNEELHSIRFIWDGKDHLFIIEESPFEKGINPLSWADIFVAKFGVENYLEIDVPSLVSDLVNSVSE